MVKLLSIKIKGENIKEEKTMRNTKWAVKIIPNPRQEREYIERDSKQKNHEKTKKLKKSKTKKQNFENICNYDFSGKCKLCKKQYKNR